MMSQEYKATLFDALYKKVCEARHVSKITEMILDSQTAGKIHEILADDFVLKNKISEVLKRLSRSAEEEEEEEEQSIVHRVAVARKDCEAELQRLRAQLEKARIRDNAKMNEIQILNDQLIAHRLAFKNKNNEAKKKEMQDLISNEHQVARKVEVARKDYEKELQNMRTQLETARARDEAKMIEMQDLEKQRRVALLKSIAKVAEKQANDKVVEDPSSRNNVSIEQDNHIQHLEGQCCGVMTTMSLEQGLGNSVSGSGQNMHGHFVISGDGRINEMLDLVARSKNCSFRFQMMWHKDLRRYMGKSLDGDHEGKECFFILQVFRFSGVWFFESGEYIISTRDDECLYQRETARGKAEGVLRLSGVWWQGIIKTPRKEILDSVIRVQPREDGSIVSQEKVGSASEWGREITAYRTRKQVAQSRDMAEELGELAHVGAFRLDSLLGQGSFGAVYRVTSTVNGMEAAAKISTDLEKRHVFLKKESHILKHISEQQTEGFCQLYLEDDFNGTYAIVMDLLDQDLESIFSDRGRKFFLKTSILLARQMIDRIKHLHSKGFIHRDVKPANFCFGRKGSGAEHIVHLVDFGLSIKYIDHSGKHIENSIRPHKGTVTGTARYASLNAHLGALSRRDDLISVFYVMLYFLNGTLPWMDLGGSDRKAKYARMQAKKDVPDYVFLRWKLDQAFASQGLVGNDFEWEPTSQKAMIAAFIESKLMSAKGSIVRKHNQERVMARPAFPGEQVATKVNGSLVATTDVQENDFNSMVVRTASQDHELFVLDKAKFARFFMDPDRITDEGLEFDILRNMGFMYYRRRGESLVYKVTADDMKHVPSGCFHVSFSNIPQPLRIGDLIATPADSMDEIYLYMSAVDGDIPKAIAQEDMVNCFLKSGRMMEHGVRIKKTGSAFARLGRKGEIVASIIDGRLTSLTTVQNETDMVVRINHRDSRIFLVYSADSFVRFFEGPCDDSGSNTLRRTKSMAEFALYSRKVDTLVYQVTSEDVLRFVPSGHFLARFTDVPQPLQAGDYIATPEDTKDGVYLYSRLPGQGLAHETDLLVQYSASCFALCLWDESYQKLLGQNYPTKRVVGQAFRDPSKSLCTVFMAILMVIF